MNPLWAGLGWLQTCPPVRMLPQPRRLSHGTSKESLLHGTGWSAAGPGLLEYCCLDSQYRLRPPGAILGPRSHPVDTAWSADWWDDGWIFRSLGWRESSLPVASNGNIDGTRFWRDRCAAGSVGVPSFGRRIRI